MNRIARTPVLAAVMVSMMISLTGCDKLKARDQLNKGVEAYKAGKYEESVRHFQQAEQLDPNLANAKAFLATALSQNVVPGITTPDNLKVAQQAIDTYKETLQQDPNNIISMKGIASLYLNIKKLDDAKQWQLKVLQADPKDPEAAYTVGVIDWTEARQNTLKLTNAQDDGVGNVKTFVKKTCDDIKQQNGPLVDEALKYLNQALANRPSYDDAMQYMNLVYRRKADIDCGDENARKADVAAAEDWGHKAMGTRKENEEKKEKANSGGIVMDEGGKMK